MFVIDLYEKRRMLYDKYFKTFFRRIKFPGRIHFNQTYHQT